MTKKTTPEHNPLIVGLVFFDDLPMGMRTALKFGTMGSCYTLTVPALAYEWAHAHILNKTTDRPIAPKDNGPAQTRVWSKRRR